MAGVRHPSRPLLLSRSTCMHPSVLQRVPIPIWQPCITDKRYRHRLLKSCHKRSPHHRHPSRCRHSIKDRIIDMKSTNSKRILAVSSSSNINMMKMKDKGPVEVTEAPLPHPEILKINSCNSGTIQ